MRRRIRLTSIGYFGTLAVVGFGVFLWTHHVEHRIERHVDKRIEQIVIQHRGDHRAIVALQHGEPAPQGGDADQSPSHGGQTPAPGQPGAHHGGDHHTPAPHEPGSEPAPAPESPAPADASHPGPAAKAVEQVESTVKNTPAGPVLEAVGGAACSLLGNCPTH